MNIRKKLQNIVRIYYLYSKMHGRIKIINKESKNYILFLVNFI